MNTDDELVAALRKLGSDDSDAASFNTTRTAVLAAVESGRWKRRDWLATWRLSGPAFAAAAAAIVLVLGWSAPPGSPLHAIENLREQATASFSGDHKADVLLGFAEERLSSARHGKAVQQSLAEARGFLDEVSTLHPAAQSAAGKRLRSDVELLNELEDENREQGSSAPVSTSPSPRPSAGGEPEQSGGSSGSDGGSTTETSGSNGGETGTGSSGSGGGSSDGGQASPTPTSSSSDGGGGGGGSSGGPGPDIATQTSPSPTPTD